MKVNHIFLKEGKSLLLLLLLLFALSIYFYKDNICWFPRYIHAWSQSDHYSLALGFEQNGLDFFHPESHSLNVQFSAENKLVNEQGITAVDFPINNYIVGILMKITGIKSPSIFRIYMLLYSCVGLIFLFLLSKLISKSNVFSGFVVLFTFTAPVFTYYQDGFLPTISSLANVFIGFYYYYHYKKEKEIKFLYIGIVFFTLAALSRTPFAIFLLSALGIEVLTALKQKKLDFKIIKAFSFSISMIGIYFLYNAWLRKTYGSIFLSSILPPESISDLKQIYNLAYDNWFFQYFTRYHYFILITFLAFFGYVFHTKMDSIEQSKCSWFVLFIILSLVGALVYSILMAQQFQYHDYYFLDTFFIVFISMLLSSGRAYRYLKNKFVKIIFFAILTIASYLMTTQSKSIQNSRNKTESWDRVEITTQNFLESEHFLDSLKISPLAKILVIDAYAPNIPLILMNRKGYYVLTTSSENIIKSLTYNYNYVVIQDQFLMSDVIASYPDLLKKLEKIAGNGKISIYKKLGKKNYNSL